MKLPFYQIDAFTNKIFGGNPACVVPLKEWLPNSTLLISQKKMQSQKRPFLLNMESAFIYAGLPQRLKWIYVVMQPLPQHTV